jgi:asparagine synthase (glutamine-hydrolysing)
MCGIAAYFSSSDDSGRCLQIVRSMCDAQASRGPDGHGLLPLEMGAIGHRRLAIIDLEGGIQPMSDTANGLHLTYNGELYNFRELRNQLSSLGATFVTQSDTEVVLNAYRFWGEKCVDRFRGMFAFAIYDEVARTLFVARDHFGIKPLVYATGPGWFAVASEFRALRCIPRFRVAPDRAAIGAYVQLGYIPAPLSAYQDARKLPPGHRRTFRLDDDSGTEEAYWEPRMAPESCGDPAEWMHEVERVCRASVEAHMFADVEFGAFLSGGVDSTLIVKWMSEITSRPVQAFTISYEESAYDETAWATEAAERLGVRLTKRVVRPDSMELLPAIVRHLGEPMADRSAISTWLVCQLAREQVPMVLSGDGGDEFFFGYESHLGWLEQLNYLRKKSRVPAGRLIRSLLHRAFPSRFPPFFHPANHEAILWSGMWQIPEATFARSGQAGAPRLVREQFERVIARNHSAGADLLLQAADLSFYLPGDILPKVDSASMAHGLEVRTPLVDREVFDLARRLPLSCRRGLGPLGRKEGKLVLKQLLSRSFDDRFTYRTKQGFLSPAADWLMPGAPGAAQIRQRLASPDSLLREILPDAFISRAIDFNRGRRIWNLLVLDEWLRQLH